jgi:molybdopterin-biosynthesis enzyme MoeA-like protein
MAGIPSVMQAMFDGLKGRLAGGTPVLSHTVSAFLPEGTIAKGLGELQQRYMDLDIGSYPFHRQGKYGASFVLRGTERSRIDSAAAELRTLIATLGAAAIEGEPTER